ncbi:MAG: hypothetical protein PVJ23_07660, partial [Anaerolineae bacterium]
GLQPQALTGEAGAAAVAQAVQRQWNTTHGLAVLCDGDEKTWVAVAGEQGVDARQMRFRGRDFRARTWTTTLALEFLRRLLLGLANGWAG